MPVDGEPGRAGFTRDAGDSRFGRANRSVEVNRGIDASLPGLVDLLRSLAHVVRARFGRTPMFTQVLTPSRRTGTISLNTSVPGNLIPAEGSGNERYRGSTTNGCAAW